jgi:hypothetical protein
MAKRRTKRPQHPIVSCPLDAELLQAQRDTFRWKFGRDPGPDDPVLLRHDTAGLRAMTDAEIDAAVIAAMVRAGARPELIHAYRRCGFLLTEERLPMSTEEERAAWLAAIDEYREFHGRRN